MKDPVFHCKIHYKIHCKIYYNPILKFFLRPPNLKPEPQIFFKRTWKKSHGTNESSTCVVLKTYLRKFATLPLLPQKS